MFCTSVMWFIFNLQKINSRYNWYLALLHYSQINWFRKSQLTSLVALGLRKPMLRLKQVNLVCV
jgi:hypothetical protein